MMSTWKLIEKDTPENIELYKNYDNTLVNSAMSKTLRNNNLKALLSLGRIGKKKGIAWKTVTRKDVNSIQTCIMETWADPEGKETWHTTGHKKFLMQFVRW